MTSFTDLTDLDGRVALVTGACGHVGRTAVGTLTDLGAKDIIADVDAVGCEQFSAEIAGSRAEEALPMAGDISDVDFWRSAPGAIEHSFGRLDIVVHCAAFVGTTRLAGWAVPFAEQTTEAWTAAMDVNLSSFFTMVRELRPMLEASPKASVIAVSSIYRMVGPDLRLYEGLDMANPAAYAASKGGLVQLTRYLATVLAPAIRVNAISPGGILRDQPAAFRQRYVDRTPLGRMATEDDLIGAIGFLASDLSNYVTGVNLPVDGGWTAW